MPAQFALAFLSTFAAHVESAAPLAWSPDSRWLAFTARPDDQARRRAEWVLFPDEVLGSRGPIDEVEAAETGGESRIWIVAADGTKSIEVDRSRLPLGAPSWDPKGRGVAYVRVAQAAPTPEQADSARLELIVRGSGPTGRVVWSDPVDPASVADDQLGSTRPSWSPDGRWIAFEVPTTTSVLVVRVEDGEVAARIDSAELPAWAPDSNRLAVLSRSDGGVPSLKILDMARDRTVELPLPTGVADQAPVWLADGRSALVLAAPASPEGHAQPILHQIDTVLGRVAPVKPVDNPIVPPAQLLGLSLALSPDGLHQFYAVRASGRESAISQHRGRAPMDRYQPLADLMPGDMALAPDGRTLALRLGSLELEAAPALLDLPSRTLRPLAPDAESRRQWLTLLVAAARSTLSTDPRPGTEGIEVRPSLPTLVPLQGWIDRAQVDSHQVRGLEPIARPLLDSDPARDSAFAAATRLLFDGMKSDVAAALRALEIVENSIDRPDLRDRLMGLRAQLEIASGDRSTGEARLAYLHQRHPLSRSVLVDTGAGVRIEPLDDQASDWIETLQKVAGGEGVAEVIDPFEMPNPPLPIDEMASPPGF